MIPNTYKMAYTSILHQKRPVSIEYRYDIDHRRFMTAQVEWLDLSVVEERG